MKARIDHPMWCDAERCEVRGEEIPYGEHRSAVPPVAPVLVQLRQRYRGGEWGKPGPFVAIGRTLYTLDEAASISAVLSSLLSRATRDSDRRRGPSVLDTPGGQTGSDSDA